ncbi:ErpK protein, partial [Butyrivibrio sp. INlla16]|uniref:ErpK protein n=1 Tax=Butyrivibrio sp. INlla16 TaxID=1520807 RepID=UPI001FA80114
QRGRTDIMARTSLDDRIKKQEEAVFKAKDRYEAELKELDKLITKRRELESKELVKAFEKSKKSLKEIIEFMNGDADEKD